MAANGPRAAASITGYNLLMFIGHFAVGYALKKPCPKTNLGVLVAAPLLLDLLWPIFLLLGLETVRIAPGDTVVTPLDLHDYPWSHSLLMALVWSVLYAALFGRRDRRLAVWLGLGVFSHWLFDFIAHRPDMPLYPGSATVVGLGLWNHLPATLVVEFGFYAAGVWLYTSSTKARDRIGRFGWPLAVLLFALFYLSAVFGPPPPSEKVIAFLGLTAWLFPLLLGWIDRHRVAAQ